jgi:hypothetical protein
MSSRRMIMPGGRAESADRLRLAVVNGLIGCGGYEGLVLVGLRNSLELSVFMNTVYCTSECQRYGELMR